MNVEKVIAGMFALILVFLLLSQASAFNSIIGSVGGFVNTQTRILQGVAPPGAQTPITGATNLFSSNTYTPPAVYA